MPLSRRTFFAFGMTAPSVVLAKSVEQDNTPRKLQVRLAAPSIVFPRKVQVNKHQWVDFKASRSLV